MLVMLNIFEAYLILGKVVLSCFTAIWLQKKTKLKSLKWGQII